MEAPHGEELFQLIAANQVHLRPWHPWVDNINSAGDAEQFLAAWRQMHATHRGVFSGIWFEGKLCGMLNLHNLDWPNRWTALSYWLDAAHQGRGIMTHCCRAMIAHCFNHCQLNRITIECATANHRSRALAKRLGFRPEGIIRQIEWLQDHFADHAMYGLLRDDFQRPDRAAIRQSPSDPVK